MRELFLRRIVSELRRLVTAARGPVSALRRLVPALLCIALVLPMTACGGHKMVSPVWASGHTVGHALGGIDGKKKINVKEGFLAAYARGTRVFETDFNETSDGQIVLCHNFDDERQPGLGDGVPTREAFLSIPVYGKYTPLDLEALTELMEEYPDTWFIVHAKEHEEDTEFYGTLYEALKAMGKDSLLDRFIVQFYREEQLQVIRESWPYTHFMYTTYKLPDIETLDDFKPIADFCQKNSVESIYIKKGEWHPEFQKLKEKIGLTVIASTINDPAEAEEFLNEGVDLYYTDVIGEDGQAEAK